jgi:hypothetical protein
MQSRVKQKQMMMDMQHVVQDQDSKRMRAIEIIVAELAKHPQVSKAIEKKLIAEFPQEDRPKQLQQALESRFLTSSKVM